MRKEDHGVEIKKSNLKNKERKCNRIISVYFYIQCLIRGNIALNIYQSDLREIYWVTFSWF